MKFDQPKAVAGVIAGLTAVSLVWGGAAYADPAQDEVAKFSELAQQYAGLADSIKTARQASLPYCCSMACCNICGRN